MYSCVNQLSSLIIITNNTKPFFSMANGSKNVCWRSRQFDTSAEVSCGHFGTGAELSGHFGTSLMVPKCLGSEVSWVRSVLTPTVILILGFPTRFLLKPKNRVTRVFQNRKIGFWLPVNPVFCFWILTYNVHCPAIDAFILTRNNSDVCKMSTIQCSVSFIYTTRH